MTRGEWTLVWIASMACVTIVTMGVVAILTSSL